MKIIQIAAIISLIVIPGCNQKTGQTNHFSLLSDTLILKTEKKKGLGLFPASPGQITFKDSAEHYLYPVKVPENISDVKLAWQYIDVKPNFYNDYKNGKSDTIRFLNLFTEKKIDTLNIPSLKDNFLSIMSGQKGGNKIFIVDENNNKDFRDDSIRPYQKLDWHSTNKLIKCKYRIYNGEKMVEDSSWVNIGTFDGNELWFFVSHHLISAFSIGKKRFQIEVADGQSNFCFDDPILTLTSQNGIKKDTLTGKDITKRGEYVKMRNRYYCFYDLSNDGKYITMVKEKHFESKTGTQEGMIALDFDCRSIEGDAISLKDYKGKYLLLINVSACWSPISSYKCYKDLTEAYKGKFEVLGIDNSPDILQNNIKDLNLSGNFIIAEYNPMIQKSYRPDYCSRTCFLINPEGRIIDIFEIFDWKKNLSAYFKRQIN